MANRVFVCGIDTSSLPKISHEKMMELLIKAQNGDEKAKEEFVTVNLRLVLSVIQRFYGNRDSVDDIFQVGCIGLIKAMNNFDTSLNLRFSTYAVPMIIGEIRRFLRDYSPVRVSRSLRDTAYKIINERASIENETNREATLDEVASALNLPLSQVVYALDAISDPVSLFDPIYHDGEETTLLVDQIADAKNHDERWISDITLADAISSLDERERQILTMRYFEGKTQMEISDEIGISQAQVSRLEKNAKSALKEKIS
ncbi:MAG: RNA polymerase sporulation sigma factor SigG [Clostridia bacterium]|nr:RNA polymerase sporulation sigma factor SigG [Clostridia bacterium]